jgi:hypothetical protein
VTIKTAGDSTIEFESPEEDTYFFMLWMILCTNIKDMINIVSLNIKEAAGDSIRITKKEEV